MHLPSSQYCHHSHRGTEAVPVWESTYTQEGTDQWHVNQGFCAQARAFVDAVKSGEPPHNTIEDAVRSMELADRIYAAPLNCP